MRLSDEGGNRVRPLIASSSRALPSRIWTGREKEGPSRMGAAEQRVQR